ncbi:MAG: Fe-S cluster assembly protein SufD [Gammaproteobacteria bacterium]
MSAVLSNVDHYQTEHARFLKEARQPGLNLLRKAAFQRFAEAGFPVPRQEAWKYTDLRALTKQSFVLKHDAAVSVEKIDGVRFAQMDCHELVFINGRFHAELSRLGELPAGVRIQNLADCPEPDALVKALNQSLVDVVDNSFTDLNGAFIDDGVWVNVPANTQLDKPIVVLYIDAAGTDSSTRMQHPRNLIQIEQGAQATLVESYIGLDDNAGNLTNAVTEIALADNARLDHYKIQQESLKGFHIGSIHVHQQRDSDYRSHSLALGASLSRTDISIRLLGENAATTLNGLYLAAGKQHVDHHTRIDHEVPHTRCEQNYRGVLNERARGVFNGKILIHQDAQKTDAQLSNANLLLSEHAQVDTKPELEIYADDVKASHGATVGQLDENALFYLRSRAIDETTARSLLTYAFASEVVQTIRLLPIRARLERIVLGKLPQTGQISEFAQTVAKDD